jgi:hypothetical protein
LRSMPFCSNKIRTCLCRKPILLHFSNWARRWNKNDQFLGCSRSYLRARVGKRKNTSEGSGDITFSNPTVVGVADRVKTLAAQGSDGSFSTVRENDILTATHETPDHRGLVGGMSISLG